ncbi:MAG: serine/threonine-protein kinase [Gemmatimonadota bacterium]|nr:serine/threonine-protein kinase [Gemmatimonadota bacterium]
MTELTARLSTALADRYRLERHLGEGGMATVYLAEDLKHKRKVALKILRPELAAVLGAERFVQEITTTANLQHPHILPLFDSGTADGFLFYVMPFIDGETLRDKLNRETQFGIDEAVRITCDIADALDYAHRNGVIHRDIKPENILLHDGRPMVADFGIALAVSAAAGGRMTETGLSLGTPHYMSPEQATAEKELSGRSDVYSLASMLYEMLTGNPPHVGASAQQIIMKIVTEEATPLTQLRKTVPVHVAAAVAKALEKLPADRFESAKAFADALTNPAFTVTTAPPAGAPSRRPAGWSARLRDPFVVGPTLVAVAAIAAALGFARRPGVPTPVPPIRFVVAATDSTRPFDNYPWPAAISPDGGTVVYSVSQGASGSMLYALRTDQLAARPIPGTTGGYQPYFSPDGTWLAFEAGGKERKVRLDGSAPVTITDANSANGADWTVGDEIVLGTQGRFAGLSRVSAAGGEAVAVTEPDTANGERNHLWPIALPDGKTIVFTIWSGSLGAARLAMTSLDDGRVVPLGITGIRPLAVLDGMLVFVQADGAVMAVPVDARRKSISGRPIPVHDPVQVAGANNGNSGIFLSRGGALVTSRGGASGRLAWVRPDGRTEPVLPVARILAFPRLSPDGRRIAVVVSQDRQSDLWIYDLTLSTFSRLTSAGTVTSADWTADGSRIVFAATGEEARGTVWSQLASGGAPAEQLFANPLLSPVATMSPDGRALLVNSLRESWDIFRVALDSERVAHPYLTTKALETQPRFSPDGKWVAVVSDESGRTEVFVRSFPEPSSRMQISVAGGSEPVWSRDGRRLYYRSGSAVLAARVSLTPTFTLLARDTLLADATFLGANFSANYDVTRDGTRVLAILPDRDDYELVVSPNWITEFRQRVAESRGGR